jgi:hypothetical protein
VGLDLHGGRHVLRGILPLAEFGIQHVARVHERVAEVRASRGDAVDLLGRHVVAT